MNCAEFEILLADHIDGTLGSSARGEFLEHMKVCAGCARLAEEAGSAVAFMGRAAEVEMPPVLVAKILQATNSGWELKLRSKGARGWINRVFAPVLKPRLVLGALFTIMSATMLTQCAGVPKRTLNAADLDPVRIWVSLDNKTQRLWDRAMKTYESMRLVYEVKSQLNEWSQQQIEGEEAAADARANSRKLEQGTPATEKGK